MATNPVEGFYLLNVLSNAIFASISSVLITNFLFSILARLVNYDFIFAIETGRILLELEEEFYSDFYAGSRGFLLHIGATLFFMLLYTLVLLPLLAILPKMGPYIYTTPSGTALFENLFWMILFGFIGYLVWYFRDKTLDKFAIYLFIYLSLLIVISGTIFGLYLFGQPGLLIW